jgi:hypothetical protein
MKSMEVSMSFIIYSAESTCKVYTVQFYNLVRVTRGIDNVQICYFMMALDQRKRGRKRKEYKNWGGGGSTTTSSDVGSKRRGSGRIATNLMGNISLSSPNTRY